MELKYYDSKAPYKLSPSELYISEFAENFDYSISNAPNYFEDIDVEEVYGSMEFVKTCARVDSVINPSTGYKYGDDFKSFIFSPNDIPMFISRLIKWKNSYWLCINANISESSSNGGIFRRCNNLLRWIDSNGKKIYEPCIIDYNIMEAGDYAGRDLTTISGFEKIWCQRNNRTIYLKPMQRFLFGNSINPVCYKIYGNGIRNFLNSETSDNMSPSLLEIIVGGNYANSATDDFENLIADAYKSEYSLIINQDNIEQIIGFETQLTVDIKKNNEIVDNKSVIWKSSNKKICSIDSEGNLKCLSLGDCVITAYMYDNPDIKYSIDVNVVENIEDKYFVEVIAENYNYENYILQGDTVVYNCILYKNAIAQSDTFSFNLKTNVDSQNYVFEVMDGNHFKIKNNKKSSEILDVVCTSGENVYEHIVSLKGAW